ncbi:MULTISPECIES: hypothetical protein [Bacillus cereus group]|nr:MULTISPECIES: hypothetical protein [Bacillus cereus group]MDA1675325.1 hypothetical protein [Bacillus cereus group sp. TH152-1LC]
MKKITFGLIGTLLAVTVFFNTSTLMKTQSIVDISVQSSHGNTGG